MDYAVSTDLRHCTDPDKGRLLRLILREGVGQQTPDDIRNLLTHTTSCPACDVVLDEWIVHKLFSAAIQKPTPINHTQ